MRNLLTILLLLLSLSLCAQTTGVGALRVNRTTVADLGLGPAPWNSSGRTYGFLYSWDSPYIPRQVLGCQVLAATLWFDNSTGKVLKRFDLELGAGPVEGHVRRCLEKDFGRGSRLGERWVWNLGSNRLEWNPEEGTISFREKTFSPKAKPGEAVKACEVKFN